MSMSIDGGRLETVDRVLAACGGGRTLHIGVDADSWVTAFRRRGVLAEICTAGDPGGLIELPFDDQTFDIVCVHRLFDELDPRALSHAIDEVLRLSGRAVWVQGAGRSREAWEAAFLARAARKHPLCQTLVPYGGLDFQTGTLDLLFERLPAGLTVGRSLADLAPERDLHMDMLREAGRRSDAHVARYTLACRFIRPGDRVLDAACGLGYGSAILHDGTLADSVTGVDVDEASVRYAIEHYGRARKRLSFEARDVARLTQLPAGSFDAIVSFETLEHLTNPDAFLASCRRLLTPAGRLICSVPNLWVDDSGTDPNPQHFHVFDREKLERACGRHFFIEQVFGQTAGGGMKLPAAARQIWQADSWADDAEWWLLVGMTDPAGDNAPPLRLGLLEHPEDDGSHALAFERDYDNPWVVKAMVTMGLRTESADLLGLLAERTLATTAPHSADAGAALCVSLYRTIARSDSADPETLEAIAAYCGSLSPNSPHARRWQISLQYALGLYHLQTGAASLAAVAFEHCGWADAMDFSPLLATKTVGACWYRGWIAAQCRDLETARLWWLRGIEVAEKALHRPWSEFLLSRRSPALFGLREAATVVDIASQCASGLHLMPHALDRPGILASQLAESLTGRAAAWERRYRASRLEIESIEAARSEQPEARWIREHAAASFLLGGTHAAPGVRVAVFGAGSGGQAAIQALRARSVEIVCVADSNPSRHGSTFEGAPVISPADLLVQDMDAIAVASIPYRHEIFEQLEALGFRHGRDFDVVSAPMLADYEPRPASHIQV